MSNYGESQDIISIHYVNVNIIGKAIFYNNLDARNIILFHSCTVTFHKSISFVSNEFNLGQIITLQSDLAYIKVMENTNIKFINNSYTYQAI